MLDELSDAGIEFLWVGEVRGHLHVSPNTRAVRALSTQDDRDDNEESDQTEFSDEKDSSAPAVPSPFDESASNDANRGGVANEEASSAYVLPVVPAPRSRPPISASPGPKQNDSGAISSGGAYPGYTGPRCYAPGGKTWSPC